MAASEIKTTIFVLLEFLKNPVQSMKNLPDWELPKLIKVQIACAAISGAVAGLFPFGLWKLLQGFILFPISFAIMIGLLSSFFYYYFQIFEGKTESFKKILIFLFFAHIPYFIFHIGSSLISLFDLIGLTLTAFLMIVGLKENFAIEKKRAIQIVVLIFGALFVVWFAEKISQRNFDNLMSLNVHSNSNDIVSSQSKSCFRLKTA